MSSIPAPLQALNMAPLPQLPSDSFDSLSILKSLFNGSDLDAPVSPSTSEELKQKYIQLLQQKPKNPPTKERIQNVRQNVKKVEDVLSHVTAYMSTLEANLADLLAQMNSLKQQSESLDAQLASGWRFEEQLVPVVTDLTVAPEVVDAVVRGRIGPAWCDNLSYINLKLELYDRYQKDIKENSIEPGKIEPQKLVPFLEEMKSLVDQLVLKAVERVRDYLVGKIKVLRYSKNTALQVLQKHLLLCKEMFSFLYFHNEPLARDLRQAYIYTVRWYYYKNFGKYLYSLEKLSLYSGEKATLLGDLEEQATAPTGVRLSWLGLFSLSSPTKPSHLASLSIGTRVDALKDDHVIPAQIAETNPLPNWPETPFRCFNTAVVDNATVEYTVLADFFQLQGSELAKAFQDIFNGVFNIGLGYTRAYIATPGNRDLYGILICIRLCQLFQFRLQQRKIPVLDGYLNLQVLELWPRYQGAVDAHCANLRKAVVKGWSRDQVHPLTAQFCEVMVLLLRIAAVDVRSGEHHVRATDPLVTSIIRLRNEYESALNRISSSLGKKREQFLYSNYAVLYSAVQGCVGDAADDEIEHLRMLIEAYKEGA